MAEPTPYALSQLFSDLIGRSVAFALTTKPPESKAPTLFGTYNVVPGERVLVVKADIPLLGCLGGALLGLPDETAIERALATPMNEPVRDAIHEVLNIASTALSVAGRVVFEKMVTDPLYCSSEAAAVISSPDLKSHYTVSINGQPRGMFILYSRY